MKDYYIEGIENIMPMDRENHENLLNELLSADLEHSRRTEILQELRTDYGSVIDEHSEMTGSLEQFKKDNDDLIISNSKLFRQIGVTGTEKEEEVVEQEFSETVTLSALEKGVAN